MLALPNFNQTFEIECNASGRVVGDILLQDKHPIAYFFKALKGRALGMSTNEKKLFALVSNIQSWRYVLGRTFTVNTDHQSIKFLID